MAHLRFPVLAVAHFGSKTIPTNITEGKGAEVKGK